MDEQRTRYINSRQGCPASPPGREPPHPPPRAAVARAGRPHGRQALDAGAAEEGAEARAAGLWLSGFHPREKAERVRNCAALPRDFVDQVVLQVGRLLLDAERPCAGSSPSGSLKAWNRGGRPPGPCRVPAGFRAVARPPLGPTWNPVVVFDYMYFEEMLIIDHLHAGLEFFLIVPFNIRDSAPSEEGGESRVVVFGPMINLYGSVQASGCRATHFPSMEII